MSGCLGRDRIVSEILGSLSLLFSLSLFFFLTLFVSDLLTLRHGQDPIPRLLCRPGSRARLFLFTTPLLARYYWVSSLFLGLFTGNLERAEADQAKPNQQSTGLREQRQEQEKKSNEKSKIRNSIDHRSQSQISISSSEV